MATLETVSDYLVDARILLQDTDIGAYRYSDGDLISNLNAALFEARRIRPDLFYPFRTAIPSYTVSNLSSQVPIDQMYRTAFVYYIVGRAQLRDNENDEDARAGALIKKFVDQLVIGA